MYELLHYVPKSYLSYLVGILSQIPLPVFLRRILFSWFCQKYKAKPEEAAQDLLTYSSFAKFFTRDLKPGLRSIADGVVSPVDGRLRAFQNIRDKKLEQIKGKDFSLDKLLGGHESYQNFIDGSFFNFYLAPGDYHHIHSPVSGKIVSSIYVAGSLWPVNDWSIKNIDGLFSTNERLITIIETDLGLVAVVMVGATNVGKISVEYSSFVTNQIYRSSHRGIAVEHALSSEYRIKAGDRIGTFHLGSSVVVLFEPNRIKAIESLRIGEPIMYGTQIATIAT